ncbi:MAG: M28 family peptidase [Candidatus Eisenbacteria bacterium]|nr:M28 family peptidase [Candidatus Eisenbacteria bacterium]
MSRPDSRSRGLRRRPAPGRAGRGPTRVLLPALVCCAVGAGGLPARGAIPAFPTERAWAHLEAQCDLGPRNPGSEGHRAGRRYLRERLAAAGGRISEQSFRHTTPGLPQPVELTNLIARFGPRRAGGLLLGAHWDTRPWAERDPDPEARERPILGANDGASGVALLLGLAELFAEQPPPLPVQLVFFDGEDLGRSGHPEEYLAGSLHFAAHLPTPYPDAAFVFDMVASESMQLAIEQRSRLQFPDLAAMVEQLAVEEGVTSFVPDYGPAVIDDHLPLIEAGLPAVLLVDFRDPVWHTQADTPERCSPESLAEAGRIATRLVYGGFFR